MLFKHRPPGHSWRGFAALSRRLSTTLLTTFGGNFGGDERLIGLLSVLIPKAVATIDQDSDSLEGPVTGRESAKTLEIIPLT